ncbi:MAG: glycosyltransferase FlmG [Kiloniellaceae bacterium]
MTQHEQAPNLNAKAEGRGKARGPHPDGKRQRGARDISQMVAKAWDLHDSGRVKAAVDMAKRAYNADRSNPVAMALLSFSYLRQGRRKDGEKLIKRALEVAPANAEVQAIYGKVLHSVGALDQAVNAYTRALQMDPQNGGIYRDLAILLIDAGVLDQATEALIMAVRLNPQDAKSFYHLGLIKKTQGNLKEAIDAYSMAVAIKPDYAAAHINLAKIAIDNKKYELGEKSCLKAIEADPQFAQSYVNMCMLKRVEGKLEESVSYGRKAVELDPMNGAAHSNLGNALMDLHRYQEALASFRKAMEFEPSFPQSYFNCGNALRLLHKLDKSKEHYDKAIELDPQRGEYIHNLGLVYTEQGQLEDALACFRKAVELTPQEPGLQFSLARALWRCEHFEESWKYFDAGLVANLRKPVRRFKVPRWRGEAIADKRLLVWREQGLGDEIDFSRRYPQAIEAAGSLVVETGERLLTLFQRTFPQATFIPENLDAENDWERTDCDLQLPAGNLLQYFPLTEEEIAFRRYPKDDIEAALACAERSRNAKGYIVPDPERVAAMAERLAGLPEGVRIGICWRSGYSHRDRDIHYTRLEMWEPIFRIPGIVFVNLFYEDCEEEVTQVEQQFGIKVHRWADIDLKNDMETVFALASQLDMVLSTSSSPSRIAEAVGTEVWLMSAAGSQLNQPPKGEYGIPHHIHWQRHWTEPWSVLMERMARALEARLKVR